MAKEKKKKHWVKIVAPKQFGGKVLGETLCSDTQKIIGRTLKKSLSELTGDYKKQSLNLGFVIIDVKEDGASTDLYRYYMSTSHLKRLVRKAKNKIDDSFVGETKDKIRIKIKPIMLTRKKTSKSILTNLRKESRRILSGYLKETSFVEFIRDIISGKVQGLLKHDLRRIYPLSLYELRVVEKIR